MSEFELYPEKPKLIEYQRRNNWSLTFFSMVLFVLLFSYIFIDKMNVILYLVGVLFLHELGHYIGMKKFDYRNVRMLFVFILGAFVHGKKDKYSQRETMLVVALGPIPGAIIGALCIYFSSSLGSPELFLLGVLFSALNVLNLLPIDPLDGGQLLKHLFNRNTELFLLIFSLLSSLIMIGVGFLIDSMFIVIFGFFMGIRVRSIQNSRELHREFEEQGIDFIQSYRELSNQDFYMIKSILLNRKPSLKKYTEIANEEELNELFAHQVNNTLVPPVAYDASIFFKISMITLWLLSLASPFILYYIVDHNWMNYAVQNW